MAQCHWDLPKEISQLIFIELSKESLDSVEQVCRTFREICQEPQFWIEKIIKEFGRDFLKHRPESETFREQYSHLDRLSQAFQGPPGRVFHPDEIRVRIRSDRIDTLLLFEKIEIHNCRTHDLSRGDYRLVSEEIANKAAESGFMAVLDWMEKKGVFPDYQGYLDAAKMGRLDVLKWGHLRNGIIGDNAAIYAAASGHLDVLTWLDEKGIRCLQAGVWITVRSDRPEILSWLSAHGYYFNNRAVQEALDQKKMNSLNWLHRQGVLNTEIVAAQILEKKDLELLIWMIESDIGTPNQKWADLAAEKGNISILECLYERQILPSVNAAYKNPETFVWMVTHWTIPSNLYPFILETDLEGLNWLEDHGVVDLETTVKVGLHKQRASFIRWALKRDYQPSVELLESESRKGNLASLIIFSEYGFLPSSKAADLAVMNFDLEMIEWMEKKRVLPTKLGAYLATCKGMSSTVKWLAEKGIRWERKEEWILSRMAEDLRRHR